MRAAGRHGVRRGKRFNTTMGDDRADSPADLVQRDFTGDRPNQLWVADFTYVSTCTRVGSLVGVLSAR